MPSIPSAFFFLGLGRIGQSAHVVLYDVNSMSGRAKDTDTLRGVVVSRGIHNRPMLLVTLTSAPREICLVPDLNGLQGGGRRRRPSTTASNGVVPWTLTECLSSPSGLIRYAYAAYGSSQAVGPLRPIAQCSHVKAVRIEIVADRCWPLLCPGKDQAGDLVATFILFFFSCPGTTHPVCPGHLSMILLISSHM
ncbi:hypothetical protein BO94DRAFT_339661 [Aspergillus sclerotioniger CBS 115572]|uniref:Uncharacterized protein n=1 Tax=Aspergillus sclerotioniger CBS 115572 TaxID=1450535 RepID=A0A317UTH9_9EURO|nr:hypothetical protein BO94DRAFT_339661 [Aspergillus sclerotioniger CBS 115572]PWY65383.1 hypothetical protein BO94DRAFT_339661 [Aspergillus sclerotioniger CBS 115572]